MSPTIFAGATQRPASRGKRALTQTSDLSGVELTSSGGYRARLVAQGQRYYVGTYATAEQAAEAYRVAKAAMQGPLSRFRLVPNDRPTKVYRNNRLGVTGVAQKREGYRARLSFRGRTFHLGTYASIEEASRAREVAREALLGPLSHYPIERAPDNPAKWAANNPNLAAAGVTR
jgi:hypothetical protein